MRALTRYVLAPLFVAAAFLTAGVSAHQPAAAAAVHQPAAAAAVHQVRFVPQGCPAGTSWDNVLHICH